MDKIIGSLLQGKTVSPVRKTISSQNNLQPAQYRLHRQKGFTLLEVLIAISLGVLMVTVGGGTVSRITYQRVRSTTRQFVGTMRKIRNDAILLNNIHRIAVDLNKNVWWVESQIKPGLLLDPNSEEAKKPKKVSKVGEPTPSNFALEVRYNKKPTELPSGVAFAGIRKEGEGLRTEGIGYIHFFPNGFSEQSILYLNKEGSEDKQSYSLIVRPTAGRIEVENTYVTTFD